MWLALALVSTRMSSHKRHNQAGRSPADLETGIAVAVAAMKAVRVAQFHPPPASAAMRRSNPGMAIVARQPSNPHNHQWWYCQDWYQHG
jgi:hypothetical protein